MFLQAIGTVLLSEISHTYFSKRPFPYKSHALMTSDLSTLFRTFEIMRGLMEVGVPELGIPILEPVFLGLIDFKFYNLTVQFQNIKMKGFKTFQLKHSHLNKDKRC